MTDEQRKVEELKAKTKAALEGLAKQNAAQAKAFAEQRAKTKAEIKAKAAAEEARS
jgi:hypothetical protein